MSNHEPALPRATGARIAKVFYTIFVNEEVIKSKNPAALDQSEEENDDIGYILQSRVPPPHTVNALKRAICKAEKIPDPDAYEMYETVYDGEPMNDTERLNSAQYPGAEFVQPTVLVKGKSVQTTIGERSSPILHVKSARRIICGQEIRSPTGILDITSLVHSVAFSPDGSLVASASNAAIQLTRIASTAIVSMLHAHNNAMVAAVAFSPDGTLVASSSDNSVHIWETASGILQRKFELRDSVSSVVFFPDGLRLAMTFLRSIIIRGIQTGDSLGTLKGHEEPVDAIAVSPNGSQLVSGSRDKSIRLWDTISMTCITVLRSHLAPITAIAFSPDNSLIVSSSDDATVKIWDVSLGKLLGTLRHDNPVYAVAVSPISSYLASGTSDGSIKIWDIRSGFATLILLGHTDSVHSVAFSPDGLTLASGSADYTLRFWNVG